MVSGTRLAGFFWDRDHEAVYSIMPGLSNYGTWLYTLLISPSSSFPTSFLPNDDRRPRRPASMIPKISCFHNTSIQRSATTSCSSTFVVFWPVHCLGLPSLTRFVERLAFENVPGQHCRWMVQGPGYRPPPPTTPSVRKSEARAYMLALSHQPHLARCAPCGGWTTCSHFQSTD